GGILVPALIYASMNAGKAGSHGWAIPTATDIAFVVGIMVLLAERVPRGLVVFLTALAIADDLGAVLAIAIFYTSELNEHRLAAAGLAFAVLVIFNRAGIRSAGPYAVVGALMWYAMLHSGVHTTVAGLLTAIAIPERSKYSPPQFLERIEKLRERLAASPPPDEATDPRMH